MCSSAKSARAAAPRDAETMVNVGLGTLDEEESLQHSVVQISEGDGTGQEVFCAEEVARSGFEVYRMGLKKGYLRLLLSFFIFCFENSPKL